MRHAAAMGRVQGGCNLVEQFDHFREGPGPLPPQRRLKIAAAQVAHHQIGALRITPVIVKRDNMEMFQPGDNLCLSLESADKFWLAGPRWQNHLYGDFALDNGLIGPIHRAKPAIADALAQFVTPDHAAA